MVLGRPFAVGCLCSTLQLSNVWPIDVKMKKVRYACEYTLKQSP